MSKVALNKLCKKGISTLRQKDIVNDGPYPIYGASGIVGYSSNYQNDVQYVAVVKDGAGVGRANICDARSSVLGTMQALIPVDDVECDYLLHLVRSLRLSEGFTGSTIPHIYFKDYGKRLVVERSTDEQCHIANLLNAIESRISIIDIQKDKLDELVKSRFIEMFGDPIENPFGWDTKPLGELGEL